MTTFPTVQRALRNLDDRFIDWALRRSRGRRVAVRSLLTALAGAIALLATSSTAFAYFSAHGSGSGSAPAGSVSITIPGTATAAGTLFPNGPSISAFLVVANPASNPTSVTLNGVTVSTPLAPTNCNVTFTPANPTNVIPPGGSPTVTVGTFSMGPGAPSACQGQAFTVGVTVTGQAG